MSRSRRRRATYRAHRARRGPGLAKIAAAIAIVIVALVIAWGATALLSTPPLPSVHTAMATEHTVPGTALALQPAYGAEEAVALQGSGTIASAGPERPSPIASLTKMMSALVILRDHPLRPGESGPDIPITAADVTTYRQELAQSDSVVAVRAGEQLSELQALEGALVPSGDNIIQLLASWDAGSTSAFVGKMNALAHTFGLTHTHYAGPSGVNPATVSTATDQLRLAQLAMANPVFRHIVAMAQVTLPVAGVVYNVNGDLGSDGIDGVKTGWVPQGGGCFVFSAATHVDGAARSIVGAVIGVQGGTPIPTALATAKSLVLASKKVLTTVHIPAGMTVATISAPYARSIRVVTASSVTLTAWKGATIHYVLRARHFASGSIGAGAGAGTLEVDLAGAQRTLPLRTTASMPGPTFTWRLMHP